MGFVNRKLMQHGHQISRFCVFKDVFVSAFGLGLTNVNNNLSLKSSASNVEEMDIFPKLLY
jgi:hypothetical protein